MTTVVNQIPVSELTETTLAGAGVFDVLMRATKAHLEAEYAKNRIRGPEYAQVYLTAFQYVLSTALQFVLTQRKAALEAQLLTEQVESEGLRQLNLVKEGCKLDAEYDVLLAQAIKVAAETTLLNQKTATEKAQTSAVGVEDNSVIGRQRLLYQAQTDGFKRSAETAAAKLMVDSWSVRRTTDEGTVADTNNKLNDATIGRAVEKMLAGVGA